MTATANVALGSYQSDDQVQQRSQLTQIMAGLGRRVMAQDSMVLPASGQTTRTFKATDLQNLGFQNTVLTRATVTARSPLNISGNVLNHFNVQVCRNTICVQSNVGY